MKRVTPKRFLGLQSLLSFAEFDMLIYGLLVKANNNFANEKKFLFQGVQNLCFNREVPILAFYEVLQRVPRIEVLINCSERV